MQKKVLYRIILNIKARLKTRVVIKVSLSTDGLIIKVNNVGEYDRAVSILTATSGVVRAFAHGARSLKNKNAVGTSLLSYSRFTLQKKKDTQ